MAHDDAGDLGDDAGVVQQTARLAKPRPLLGDLPFERTDHDVDLGELGLLPCRQQGNRALGFLERHGGKLPGQFRLIDVQAAGQPFGAEARYGLRLDLGLGQFQPAPFDGPLGLLALAWVDLAGQAPALFALRRDLVLQRRQADLQTVALGLQGGGLQPHQRLPALDGGAGGDRDGGDAPRYGGPDRNRPAGETSRGHDHAVDAHQPDAGGDRQQQGGAEADQQAQKWEAAAHEVTIHTKRPVTRSRESGPPGVDSVLRSRRARPDQVLAYIHQSSQNRGSSEQRAHIVIHFRQSLFSCLSSF